MAVEPRIRVSVALRWQRPAPAVQAREAGQGVLAAARRRRQVRREPGGRAPARAARGGRRRRQPRLRRANCDRRLDRSGEELRGSPRRAHHLRRRPDRTVARGRDVEGRRRPRPPSLQSERAGRLVLHPPIQRFLARWRSGDPIVYLGALWAPDGPPREHRARDHPHRLRRVGGRRRGLGLGVGEAGRRATRSRRSTVRSSWASTGSTPPRSTASAIRRRSSAARSTGCRRARTSSRKRGSRRDPGGRPSRACGEIRSAGRWKAASSGSASM